MTLALFSFTHSGPCCARITPTRLTDWRSSSRRLVDRCRDALRQAAQALQRRDRLPELDAATLRDLGLSHAPAAWVPRDPIAHPWL